MIKVLNIELSILYWVYQQCIRQKRVLDIEFYNLSYFEMLFQVIIKLYTDIMNSLLLSSVGKLFKSGSSLHYVLWLCNMRFK